MSVQANGDLWLFSDGLCSKWGFNDGEMPDHVADYCDEHDVAYRIADWQQVLRNLVRRHLLPALAVRHQVEVYDIETNHNPIRASRVDGQEIDDYAGHEAAPALTPDGVLVPAVAVVAEIRAVLDTPG